MNQKHPDLQTSVAVILTKVSRIENDLDKVNRRLEYNYVTQDQFEPVRKLVYGMVSIILLAVIGAIVALVIK
jgi:hypothetical protein